LLGSHSRDRLAVLEGMTRVLESLSFCREPGELLRGWGSEILSAAGQGVAIFLREGVRWIRPFPDDPLAFVPFLNEAHLDRCLVNADPIRISPFRPGDPAVALVRFAGRQGQRGVLALWEGRKRVSTRLIARAAQLSTAIGRTLTALRRIAKNREDDASLERARLAAEMHDGFFQTVLSAKLCAEVCAAVQQEGRRPPQPEIERTAELLRLAVREGREFLLELRPAPLQAEDFVPALREYAEYFYQQSRLPVDVRVEGEGKVFGIQAREITGLLRESLTNIRKHARARSVRVVLAFSREYTSISISDDGIGFDVKEILRTIGDSSHYGLIGMRHRTESMGGEMHLRSDPGKGTTLQFRIPCPQDPPVVERRQRSLS
jgi:signal transduction histidine kinase